MIEKDNKKPIIDISEEFKKDIDILERSGALKGYNHKHVFLLALALGFENGRPKPIKKRLSGGFLRREQFNEEEEALIRSIAITHTKGLDILKKENFAKIYEIMEEYANAGFPILQAFLSRPGTFEKNLHSSLNKKIKDYKKLIS